MSPGLITRSSSSIGVSNPRRVTPLSPSVANTLLGEINREYRGKVESGRLAPTRVVRLPLEEFIALVGGERQRVGWEAQFKFLPFLSEELGEREVDAVGAKL